MTGCKAASFTRSDSHQPLCSAERTTATVKLVHTCRCSHATSLLVLIVHALKVVHLVQCKLGHPLTFCLTFCHGDVAMFPNRAPQYQASCSHCSPCTRATGSNAPNGWKI